MPKAESTSKSLKITQKVLEELRKDRSMNPHIEEVIITEIKRGSGTVKDAVRKVRQIWSKEGKLLGELDPLSPVYLPSIADISENFIATDCEHGCWEMNPDSCIVFGGDKDGNLDMDINEVVDSMEEEKLECAMDQVERTLAKKEKA